MSLNKAKPKETFSNNNAELVSEYTASLLKAAFSFGFSAEQAEDLVQNVWVTYLHNPDNFQGKAKMTTYLYGILINKARELRRENQKSRPEEQIEEMISEYFNDHGSWSKHLAGPEQMIEASQTLSFIEKCLNELTLNQRAAFYLREVEEYPNKEICNILDLTVTNLGVLLFRAKAGLRHCLEFKMKA